MMKETGGLYVCTYGIHQMHKLPADKWAILIKVNITWYHVTAWLTCGYGVFLLLKEFHSVKTRVMGGVISP